MAVLDNEPRGAPPSEFCAAQEPRRILRADPSNYRRMISGLVPGDTLVLAGGEYPRLAVANLAGAPGRCITITGQAGERPAVIFGEIGNRTVEIIDSSYIVIGNLVIDGRGLPGADGIKALASPHRATHHIVLDGNLILGAGADQQTDGITTKTPTWNWVIRRNTILSAGTVLRQKPARQRDTTCRADLRAAAQQIGAHHRRRGQRDRDRHRQGHRLQCRPHPRHAGLDVSCDVFEHDDRIIDDKAG